jgi:hypothetical protein
VERAQGGSLHAGGHERGAGELVETRGLSAPVHTRRIQLKEGVPVVTDGPYAEAEEVLAGYWVVGQPRWLTVPGCP